jgi:hypothetical protein
MEHCTLEFPNSLREGVDTPEMYAVSIRRFFGLSPHLSIPSHSVNSEYGYYGQKWLFQLNLQAPAYHTTQ